MTGLLILCSIKKQRLSLLQNDRHSSFKKKKKELQKASGVFVEQRQFGLWQKLKIKECKNSLHINVGFNDLEKNL